MATQPEVRPDPHEELVKVFDTDQESEAMVVQGLLESAGIESIITNLDAPQDVLPGVGGVIIQVRAEQAKEALQVIEDYQSNPGDEGDLSEEEPPA
jgi:Putative prokaryotic signal transducing protein